jgi:hypothetical protein
MQRLLPLLISTVLLGAQTLPESTAYSVAYVDIAPASRTVLRAGRTARTLLHHRNVGQQQRP